MELFPHAHWLQFAHPGSTVIGAAGTTRIDIVMDLVDFFAAGYLRCYENSLPKI